MYHELFGNAAQLKVGVDYQILTSVASFQYPTNNLYYIAQYDPTLGPPAAPEKTASTSRSATRWDQFIDPQPSTSRGKIWGFYALEKFEVNRLSLNLGVRIDYQTGASDLGNTVVNATNASPRLSAAYDITGDGKTLVSAGYGQYYQFIIQSLADSTYSGVPQEYQPEHLPLGRSRLGL